ncbi:MAG: MFS transporter [Acidimicrobiia bacterium]|nr:MAG: MFS transporter [Acidimicrobiia bacterium]
MPTETDAHTRSRLIGILFAGTALNSVAFIGVVTVSSLVAEQVTGSASLSGLPNMMGTLGTAAGAAALSALSFKIGRRRTFTIGFALAMVGSILAAASVGIGSLTVLMIAMAVLGFGRSVSQLARFAAGDLRTRERRASAISLIVWASTLGAIIGPLLFGPTSAMATRAGFDQLIGPIMIGVVGFALASILMFVGLRPEPLSLTVAPDSGSPGEASPIREIFSIPTVQLATIALITSQFVMVFIMTMTPLHIRANNGDLGTVGIVMMAHALGMFSLAPITGKLVDRHGPRRIIMLAVAVLLVSSLIAATAATADTVILVVSLFLLGVGWNFGFVAGSTELQIGLPLADRLKIQGVSDSITWISGGLGAALSGVIVGASSYVVLSIIGAVFALAPIPLIARTTPRARTRKRTVDR